MESNRIKILVDSYFEGTTTRNEQTNLANYLATSDNLPAEYASVKMMFEAMGLLREIEAPKAAQRPHTRLSWRHITTAVTVAASILLAIVITTNKELYSTSPAPAIICHVDGMFVSDQAIAEQEARRILGNMNTNVTLAMASVDKINILATKR